MPYKTFTRRDGSGCGDASQDGCAHLVLYSQTAFIRGLVRLVVVLQDVHKTGLFVDKVSLWLRSI